MKKFLKIAFKSDVLIRIMLLLMFAQGSLASHAQTIGIIEALSPVAIRQGPPFNGNPTVEFPIAITPPGQFYVNRFYKYDNTGKLVDIGATPRGYDTSNHGWVSVCVNCTTGDFPQIYRFITLNCNPGIVRPWSFDSTQGVETNPCTASVAWSNPLTWFDYKVPNPATGAFSINRDINMDVKYDFASKLTQINANAKITVISGVTMTSNTNMGGTFVNNGVMKCLSSFNKVVNNGLLSPGTNGVGVMTCNSYKQSATGTLNMELESTASNDNLRFYSSPDNVLNGTLKVSLINGFVPVQHNSFKILETGFGGTYTGTFSNVDMPPLPNGLKWQVYYKPDEVRLTIVDSSKLGGAFNFNDFGYTFLPTNNFPVGNSNYTIESWVKTSEDRFNNIINWGANSQNTFNGLALLVGNKIDNYWGGGLSTELIVNAPTVNDGNWHHLAATFDGTTRKIYMDGVLLGSDNPTGHNTTAGTTGFLGGFDYQSAFKGMLDEVRVFSKALSQGEITSTMNCEIPGNTSGLSAYFKFNQGLAFQNNTVITGFTDASPNGNNITLGYGYGLMNTLNNFVVGKIANGHSCTPPTFSTTTAKTDAACSGTFGSISANVSGGTPPYGYKLSGNVAQPYLSSNNFNVRAGSHLIYFTDANGFKGVTGLITVMEPLKILPVVTNKKDVTCYSGADGFVVISPTNGIAPFQYKIGATGTYGSSDSFPGLRATSYRLYIKDAGSCADSIVTTIIPPLRITATYTKTDETCPLAKNGTATVTGANGVSPYQYRFGRGGTYSTTNTFGNLATGNYRIYVIDNNGCGGISVVVPIRVINTICSKAKEGTGNAMEKALSADNKQSLSIFPNPTKGAFTLQLNGQKTGKAEITVTSESGVLIENRSVKTTATNQQLQFNIANKAPGIYFIKVVSEQGVQTSKVVVD